MFALPMRLRLAGEIYALGFFVPFVGPLVAVFAGVFPNSP